MPQKEAPNQDNGLEDSNRWVEVHVDIQALFQLPPVVASNDKISFSEYLGYELSVYPLSLFTSNGLPRSATKL